MSKCENGNVGIQLSDYFTLSLQMHIEEGGRTDKRVDRETDNHGVSRITPSNWLQWYE